MGPGTSLGLTPSSEASAGSVRWNTHRRPIEASTLVGTLPGRVVAITAVTPALTPSAMMRSSWSICSKVAPFSSSLRSAEKPSITTTIWRRSRDALADDLRIAISSFRRASRRNSRSRSLRRTTPTQHGNE